MQNNGRGEPIAFAAQQEQEKHLDDSKRTNAASHVADAIRELGSHGIDCSLDSEFFAAAASFRYAAALADVAAKFTPKPQAYKTPRF